MVFGKAMTDRDNHDYRKEIESAILDKYADKPPVRAKQAFHKRAIARQGEIRQEDSKGSGHDQGKSKGQAVPDCFQLRVRN